MRFLKTCSISSQLSIIMATQSDMQIWLSGLLENVLASTQVFPIKKLKSLVSLIYVDSIFLYSAYNLRTCDK